MARVREALLDTSVLIAHIRKRINLANYAAEEANWYVSVISQGELLQGVLRSSRPNVNNAELRLLLDDMGALLVTEETANNYARIAADLESNGLLIPQNDMWIAACAIEHKLPVATQDPHFQRVEGLQVLMW